MQFQKVLLTPGINREGTEYDNSGGWWDCDKIRFRQGRVEKIGGWVKHTTEAAADTIRALKTFTKLDGTIYIGAGATKRFYIVDGASLFDITPLRQTTTPTNPLDTTNTSTTVVVTDTGHGAVIGDLVEIVGATTVGGVPADELNGVHEITAITTNTWSFTVTTAATSTANGGGTPTLNYYIYAGSNATIFGTGWGAGTWGEDGWGDPSTTTVESDSLRVWSMANFGEDLIINPRNGSIYYWDTSAGTGTRAVDIDTLAGASNAPSIATKVIVSERDRHVIALGCDPLSAPGVRDPMLIRWSNQESAANWTPSTTTTSGDLLLSNGSTIITAIQTRQEILIWTDAALYSMRYIGGLYTFGVSSVSEDVSIISFNAMTATGDVVYWMGEHSFYAYSGQTVQLPCTVEDYVFKDLNYEERDKVVCGSNAAEGEIFWFYPSASSTEVNRYVVYNYLSNIWYYGTLPRTAWLDSGVIAYPLAASTDGYIYEHEKGLTDGSTNPPSRIDAFAESSPIEIGEGYRFVFMKRIIPDVTFTGSTADNPNVNLVIKARNAPGAGVLDTSTNSVTRTSTLVVEQYDQEKWVRIRGRSFTFRIEDVDDDTQTGTRWRLGAPRVSIRTDGRQ